MAAEDRPVIVLCDLLADLALRIASFPVTAASMQRLKYLELGPGGAGNTAITAARLGLPVACLGEVGDDLFGDAVRAGLDREGIDTAGMIVNAGGRTPVAGVIVDERAEPAYLGYAGDLRLTALPQAWAGRIRGASAVFADGWAEDAGVVALVLGAFRTARAAGVPVFFDPGPGNPAIDNAWHGEALALATVALANEGEAGRLTGHTGAAAAGRALLASGASLAVIKRGAAGCLVISAAGSAAAPGYPVTALDATGAGDSAAGAAIFGYLRGLEPARLAVLCNAAGAAKVQKRGTGRNMPTRAEVAAVLARFGEDVGLLE